MTTPLKPLPTETEIKDHAHVVCNSDRDAGYFGDGASWMLDYYAEPIHAALEEAQREIERLKSCPNESWECAKIIKERDKRIEDLENRLDSATEFYVDERVRIQNRDPDGRYEGKASWAICDAYGSSNLNKDGDWEYEPLPSSRDSRFLSRCRHTLEEALSLISAVKKGKP